MGLRETLDTVHRTLDAAGIDHALIGGLGLAALGVHRATFDVDLLISGEQKMEIKTALEKAGWKVAMETTEVLHFEGMGRVDVLLADIKALIDAQPGLDWVRIKEYAELFGEWPFIESLQKGKRK